METEASSGFNGFLLRHRRLLLCLLLFLAVYGASVGVRLVEAPLWQDPGLEVAGEKLQATHDAYFWLAGAKDTSRDPDRGLAHITGWIQSATGVQYGNLGFWLPAFLAPLAVIPFVLLGWYWRLEEGALPAAILAASCQGFLLRSRLGFYDQDILSLFLLLLFCALLVFAFSAYLRPGWRRSRDPQRALSPDSAQRFWARCIGVGIAGMVAMWFHSGSSPVLIAALAALLVCILVLSSSWRTAGLLGLGLLIVYGLSLAGPIGLIVLVAGLVFLYTKPHYLQDNRWLVGTLCVLALILFIDTNLHGKLLDIVYKIIDYAKIYPAMFTEEGALSLPSVKQSIREAQSIDWGNLVDRIAGSWLIFIPALVGLAYVVWSYPTTLVFVPMLVLSIFSFKLGNRFTMYGGPLIGLGLGFGAALLLWRTGIAKSIRVLSLMAIAVLVMLPIWDLASQLRPAPVVSKNFARAYIDLEDRIPEDARLWQWWDFGYAAQYYAERITFGDGGNHAGPMLYPLAKVHATRSPQQASQMMHYITASQPREYARNQTAYQDMPEFWKPYLANPVALLEDKGPEGAMAFVESLAEEDKEFSGDLPPQYLVLTWQNLNLAYWISYFGNWNLEDGEASPGRIRQIRGEASFNTRRGTVKLRTREIPLEELTLIQQGNIRTKSWPNGSNVYAVLNQVAGELYLMDGKIYNSMMVRMLLQDPSQFSDHFELVMDRAPWVRVYRAK
jgi:dolichyl-diphosphooligosaccharide--protein glycosyltransferase